MATGPCKEVIKRDNFSLLDFPILQCWPKDAGRFITLPCVVSRDPKTGKRNVGMYRMQIYDERTTGMHWQRQKVGAEHYREALRAAAQVDVGASVPARASAAVDIMARTSGRITVDRRRAPAGKDGSCGGHRHRPRPYFFRDRSRAARRGGISHRRLSPPEAG